SWPLERLRRYRATPPTATNMEPLDITTIARDEVNDLESAFQSEAAFRSWYDRALPRVYGYVLGYVSGRRELAEEITQLTFTEAIRNHRAFDGRSDSVTWLCSIARHKIADHWRRQERDERRRLRLVAAPMDDETRIWRSADQRQQVLETLDRLPVAQR